MHPQLNWFCVRTHSKREHIAAAWLERHLGIEVFLPRIRFRRGLRRGPVWFTEALFPNYLFARFEPADRAHRVDCAPGVHGIVRFGAHSPVIPESVIGNLRATVGAGQVQVLVIDGALAPGRPVRLAGGVFHGLEAVVASALPGRQRVAVLLDFLGRQTKVELAKANVIPMEDQRRWLAP